MDNVSTELCKNNKKIRNQKVLQVLHFEYTSYPMGSQQSLENSRLWLKAFLGAPVTYSLILQFKRYSTLQSNRTKEVQTLREEWFCISWREFMNLQTFGKFRSEGGNFLWKNIWVIFCGELFIELIFC